MEQLILGLLFTSKSSKYYFGDGARCVAASVTCVSAKLLRKRNASQPKICNEIAFSQLTPSAAKRSVGVYREISPCHFYPRRIRPPPEFLDPEGGSQNATLLLLLLLLLLVISSLKIPKAFLIRSGEQRNFAYTHSC